MIGNGKGPMTGSQSARWVLRATLGKSSDRGESECFRPSRTLREAPERGKTLIAGTQCCSPARPTTRPTDACFQAARAASQPIR